MHSDSMPPSGGALEWLPSAADSRGNVVRIICIAAFYSIHLLNVYLPTAEFLPFREFSGLSAAPVPTAIHLSVSIVVFGWLMQAVALHAAMLSGKVTDLLALVFHAGDIVWLTAVLCLSTGAGGAMVAAYFLIISLSGLRLNLWLIRWTTVMAAMGYLTVLGSTRWPMGLVREVDLEPVARHHQLMVLTAIVLCGVIVGQIVRLAWGVVASRSKRTGGTRND